MPILNRFAPAWALALLAAPLAAQQRPARSSARAASAPAPLTRPERTGYRETSRYEDVMDFLRAVTHGQRRMHLATMGYTSETRAIPLVVVGDVADASPEAVLRSGKLRIYIQADIHAGEVEGKEAVQVLLRDIAAGAHPRWLDSVVLLIAPIYNADGNERVSLTNRPLQLGPVGGTGQRANAMGLDLNRDHVKLESPEARSQVLLLRQYDPQVAMDLHTTDGSVHGYMLTYTEPQHPATDTAIVNLLRRDWLPEVTRRIKARDGWDIFYYGNFPEGPGGPGRGGNAERGWYSFDARPRLSQNYWGMRNRIGILSEAYSYASFENRIRATLRFVEENVDYASTHAGLIRRVTAEADARSVVGESLAVRARLRRGPDIDVLTGDAVEERNPFTGQRMLRRLPVTRAERMPDFTRFEGSEFARVPRAYFIPANLTVVIERLEAHGVRTSRLPGPLVVALERFCIDSTYVAPREFQGHRERTVRGAWEASPPPDTLPAGTVVVAMDQPLARLIFLMLEPRSDDGLLEWNFFDDALNGAKYYSVRRTFTAW
jgi:hypothetical protein